MVEKVSFTVYMKDLLSGGLKKLATTGNTTLAKLRGGFRRLSTVAKTSLAKIKTSMLGLNRTGLMLSGTMRTLLAGFGIFAILGLGSNILKWGADMEQTRIAFHTLLQDVDRGNALFENINEFANRTPFDNIGLQANAKTLLSFGIAGDKVMGTLKMLGDVSAGNKDRMRALTLAFAQTQAAGKLMGQDLLQYVNAGFNPLKVISEKTGKSLMELRSEMQKGAISSEMVAWAFQTATSKGGMFYKMMDKQSQTIAGKWSTLVGKIQLKLGGLVESNNIVFTSIIDKLISGFEMFASVLEKTFGWIERNKEILLPLAQGIGIVAGAYFIWTAAQWALNTAMTANPIGIIIVAVGALVGGIIWAWNKFEGFRKVVLGFWGVAKLVFGWIKTYGVLYLKAMFRPITLLWNKFEGFRKFLKEGLWNTVKNVFTWIGDKLKSMFSLFWRLIKPILKLLGIDKAFKDGAAKAIRPAKPDGAAAEDTGGGSASPFPGGGGATGGNTNLGTVDGSIQGMAGSGRVKNITISIGSLIERFEIHTTEIQGGIDDMADKVKEALMTAVNDANLATG